MPTWSSHSCQAHNLKVVGSNPTPQPINFFKKIMKSKKNIRVLITGADGFIGSHLAELLYRDGYEITALSQLILFNNLGWLSSVFCKDK